MVKNQAVNGGDIRDAGSIPWRRSWQPTPVFLPGESPWTEDPGGPHPWGCKESDMTEQLSTHTQISHLNSSNLCNGDSVYKKSCNNSENRSEGYLLVFFNPKALTRSVDSSRKKL